MKIVIVFIIWKSLTRYIDNDVQLEVKFSYSLDQTRRLCPQDCYEFPRRRKDRKTVMGFSARKKLTLRAAEKAAIHVGDTRYTLPVVGRAQIEERGTGSIHGFRGFFLH